MAFRSRDLGVKLAAGNALCLGNSECLQESGCGGTQVCISPTQCDEKSCHHSFVCPDDSDLDLSVCGGTQQKTANCPQTLRQGDDGPNAMYKAASHLAGLELLRAQLRESLVNAAL